MSYYRVCPFCWSHLDPGEVCNCTKEESAASAADTDGGAANVYHKSQISADIITKTTGDNAFVHIEEL